jgi:hypothetical protein
MLPLIWGIFFKCDGTIAFWTFHYPSLKHIYVKCATPLFQSFFQMEKDQKIFQETFQHLFRRGNKF